MQHGGVVCSLVECGEVWTHFLKVELGVVGSGCVWGGVVRFNLNAFCGLVWRSKVWWGIVRQG